jgi:hypothetical protein
MEMALEKICAIASLTLAFTAAAATEPPQAAGYCGILEGQQPAELSAY